MEQTKALQGLMESADLVKMLEDIIGVGAIDRLSPASLSGMRITLKGVRETILTSHDALASDMIKRSQVVGTNANQGGAVEKEISSASGEAGFARRDLRSTIDRVREQQTQG